MPLIQQQDVVSVFAPRGGIEVATKMLIEALEKYPKVRIVSLVPYRDGVGTILTAVIETVES